MAGGDLNSDRSDSVASLQFIVVVARLSPATSSSLNHRGWLTRDKQKQLLAIYMDDTGAFRLRHPLSCVGNIVGGILCGHARRVWAAVNGRHLINAPAYDINRAGVNALPDLMKLTLDGGVS